ncbi:MAG: ROK family protein [Gammaproteobacteria bacterium]|nr:MAG: ROK family protein [Gammaproteobacteria bacterium]
MRIGIDLGGTKISAIALDDGGETLVYQRVATPSGDYDATIRTIVDLVDYLESCTGKSGNVGIGTPGAISPRTGLLRNSNSVCLNGRPLDKDITLALGREVRIANDADCFALSEATDGAGADVKTVFGVIIGTGVGGGLVVNGELLTGPNAIAGEWGHNPLPWVNKYEFPGRKCYCGKRGCIETYLSGPGFETEYKHRSGRMEKSPDIVRLASEDNETARACLEGYIDRMTRALANVINILDPEVIVLGGGMSNINEIYPAVQQRLSRYVFADSVDTRLVRHHHGDDSGVRGAAWLW